MKPLAFLAVISCLVASASADWIIESKMENPQMNTPMVIKIKGDKVRSDLTGPMGAMSSIADSATGDSIQLLHAQKVAMKTSAAQMKQAMEAVQRMTNKTLSTSTKITPTGQKEKVGEFDCEIWSADDGSTSTKYWVAPGHPQAKELRALDQKMRTAMMSSGQIGPDTSVLPGPVMKTQVVTSGVTTTVTVLSIKQQNVDASEFDVPAGYQSMTMPSLPVSK